MRGEIGFVIESGTGLLRVTGRGMWTAEQARWHFAQLDIAITGLRAQGKPVRTLVDLRAAQVQSRETVEAMTAGTRKVHGPDDRVAIVSSSALHVMQVKASARVDHLAIFQDMDKAVAWLRDQTADLH
jgi:hypothetical protein